MAALVFPTTQTQAQLALWRSEISSPPLYSSYHDTHSHTTSTSRRSAMKNILKKSLPIPTPSRTSSTSSAASTSTSSISSTSSSSTKALRPRSLSFHSPISTTSFSTSAESSNGSYMSQATTFIEEDDEEAVAFDDDDEDFVEQGDRIYGYGSSRKDSFEEKMERLERARRLLESYGGRC